MGSLIFEGAHTIHTIGAKFFYYGLLAFKTYENNIVQAICSNYGITLWLDYHFDEFFFWKLHLKFPIWNYPKVLWSQSRSSLTELQSLCPGSTSLRDRWEIESTPGCRAGCFLTQWHIIDAMMGEFVIDVQWTCNLLLCNQTIIPNDFTEWNIQWIF